MTLDIENQLMLYLSGTRAVKHLNNRRTNPQGKYYPVEERDIIFSKIWLKLHKINENIFPLEEIVKDSALFKASPFHELTPEQQNARQGIFVRVAEILKQGKTGQLILVEGAAGSGKTVLLSTLFYELKTGMNEFGDNLSTDYNHEITATLLVNHDEQLKVYQEIMEKLGTSVKSIDQTVTKPTHFILQHSLDNKELVDVVLVDEAHLLWTQGKQSYRGDNQLFDLLKRARVVIAVFDPQQILATNGYWEDQLFRPLEEKARQNKNLFQLHQQLRIQASPAIEQWLQNFVYQGKISSIPGDDYNNYDLRVFPSPEELYEAIKKKATNQKNGLSRMLATFDWPFINGKKDLQGNPWRVTIGSWSLPWNLQLKPKNSFERYLAWAEQTQTINEIGSTFTIQGFDLNYAGVIIGPSVSFRNGKVVFDASKSCNKRAKNRRTLQNGKKRIFQ